MHQGHDGCVLSGQVLFAILLNRNFARNTYDSPGPAHIQSGFVRAHHNQLQEAPNDELGCRILRQLDCGWRRNLLKYSPPQFCSNTQARLIQVKRLPWMTDSPQSVQHATKSARKSTLMEHKRLFISSKEKETVVDRLEDFIATALLYKAIVEGNDAENTTSEYKKESTRMKARYLGQAYRIALDSMPYKTRNDCCQEAINQLAAVHIRHIKNARVLERWNVEFRQRKTFRIKNKGK
jgi:hypothetical protein